MKTKFFSVMFSMLAMISCSENESYVGDNIMADNEDAMALNVYAGTTRGTDATTATLETSAWVELYIDDGTNNDSYEFRYEVPTGETQKDWTLKDTKQLTWGEVKFPANFYSLHDGVPVVGFTIGTDEATSAPYSVTGASTEHKDLIYHASQLNAIPTGGTVNAYHKHALSKIHLYAATGKNNLYIARVNLVNIGSTGEATITPLAATAASTENNITWTAPTTPLSYLYHYIGTGSAAALNSETNGGNPIINPDPTAPLMIIPQTTIDATITHNSSGDKATISSVNSTPGSYIEVIYYMADSNGQPLVGYKSVSARPDAADYIGLDQTKTLYVMGGFPLGETFSANKVYDVTLGLGADGSTGGKLLVDYYVDKEGNPISLTNKGADADDDSDDTVISPVDIPEIDNGDDILAGSDDLIDIIVTARGWLDGNSYTTEISTK